MQTYFERIESAVNFIEEHLTEPFLLQDVAKAGCFSLYHFHRVFHALVGSSLKEYIRKRRLSYCASLLLDGEMSVGELAALAQYESPEAFSRAFKSEFGLPPSIFRKKGGASSLFLSFSPPSNTFVKGDMSMEPEIVTMPGFSLCGLHIGTTILDGQNYGDIPLFWQEMIMSGFAPFQEITNLRNRQTAFGVTTNVCDDGSFDYVIAYEMETDGTAPEGFYTLEIPQMTYAHFIAKGKFPEVIQHTNQYIYGTWFAESGYEPSQMFEIERYDEHRLRDPHSSECDIFIPITL